MAGCDKIAFERCLSQNWQCVGRAWPQARPSLVLFRCGETGHEFNRSLKQPLDRIYIRLLVVSGIFQSRADHQPTIAARHQIHLFRSHHVINFRAADDCQHLSFDRHDRKSLWPDTACPSTRAVHHDGRCIRSLVGFNAGNTVVLNQHGLDLGTGGNIYVSMFGGLDRRQNQRTRVD